MHHKKLTTKPESLSHAGMTRIGFVSGRPMTLDAVQQYMADETKRWSEVIVSRNIKIEP